MIFKRYISTTGLLAGSLFFALSLTPSLLPRNNLMQGLISGFALTSGYGIGVVGWWLWSYFGLPTPNRSARIIIKYVAGGICLLLALTSLWWANSWQNSLRALMGLEKSAGIRPVVIGLTAIAIFLLLLILARSFYWTFRRLSDVMAEYVPGRVSKVAGLLVALTLFGMAVNGVLFSLILRTADATYKQWDAQTEPDVEQPADPQKTGSTESLLNWDEIGREGREFLSEIPDTSDLGRFTSVPVQKPIRVYVSIHAADNFEERAALALEELKRVDAFERSVLVIITPTGTGWVSPEAIEPLEYLHRGDVASVAAQYSYLPSALSLLFEDEYGVEMSRALFQEIYGYWTELPEHSRPELYLQGLSLGALNSDRSFDFFDIINDPFNGALWSGPPFRSHTWQEVTERRNPDSPAWLPTFRDGSVVRFANQYGGLEEGKAEWGDFRIAYLQYASDPIVFFDSGSFWREPEWLAMPRGPDVSESFQWYPIVTMLQLVADMVAGTAAPTGYGHEYAAVDYLEAWYHLTEPRGWSATELEQLRGFFAGMDVNK